MLLATKLYVPRTRSRNISRDRLIAKIEEGKNATLILISAPAGFGKTSLICEWIEKSRQPVAWYSLDEGDNNLNNFCRYLVRTLQKVNPSLDRAFAPLLAESRVLKVDDIFAVILNRFAAIDFHTYLILDDYQRIQSTKIHDRIQFLLQNLPEQLHIVLLTRQDPPFSLTNLRAHGHLTEIRTLDLRFTREEARQFLKKVMNLDIHDRQINQLADYTEGWITGLQLAGISLQSQKIQDFRMLSRDKLILDYLLKEVYDNQPRAVKDFLLQTCILKNVHPNMCRDVLGVKDPEVMLSKLARSNLFLYPLNQHFTWFRYHSLFADLLKNELQRSRIFSIDALHKKAASWYAKNGYLAEAFYHGYACGDRLFITELLEAHLFTLIINYRLAVADKWLERCPMDIIQARPFLMLFRAWLDVFLKRFENFAGSMKSIENVVRASVLKESKNKQKLAECMWLTLKVFYAACLRRIDEVRSSAAETLACMPRTEKFSFLHGLVHLALALVFREAGDFTACLDSLENARKMMEKARCDHFILQVDTMKAGIERAQGNRFKFKKELDGLFTRAEKEGMLSSPGMVEIYMEYADYYYESNDLEKSLDNIEKGLKCAREAPDNGNLVRLNCLKSLILQHTGYPEEALRSMQEGLEIATRSGYPHGKVLAETNSVRLSILQQNLQYAVQWADTRKPVFRAPLSSDLALECLAFTRLGLARGDEQQVLEVLKFLHKRALEKKMMETVLRAEILLAAALFRMDETAKALALLEKAILFAVPQDYIRSFADEAQFILKMLLALEDHKNQVISFFVSNVIRVCHFEHDAGDLLISQIKDEMNQLTPRELEILRLIGDGLSNKDISAKLFVSLNTLKTHIKNLYSKLNIRKRTEAILLARKMKR